ncbi:MAG: ABC transporter permease [Ignavibacteriae bacterium]|nr:ABC transporter permease [Ignavibacteriota bacterium]
MKIPFKYILRNFWARRLTTSITLGGVALVVFVFAAVLMMAYGVNKTLASTGSEENVIVTRKSSQGEITSIIDRETANIIYALPGIAKGSDGKPLASGEPVVVINLNKKSGGLSNVTVRAVAPPAFILRPQVKLKEGRMFKFGSRELIVGTSIAQNFEGASVGGTVKFAGDQWTIVGIFDANGGGFESEMWGDAEQLLAAFNRSSYSTITFKLANPDAFDGIQSAFAKEPRLQQFEPKIEKKYFEEQSEMMATFIRILGIFITVIFSAGAIIGAMITMYGAVANRTVEVGTLRALGFRRSSVLIAFLIESLIISFFGGCIGLLLASSLQFVKISTLNFSSFAELAFSFALSPSIIINSLIFALIMGFVGGFLPAIHAARLKIVNALRAS